VTTITCAFEMRNIYVSEYEMRGVASRSRQEIEKPAGGKKIPSPSPRLCWLILSSCSCV